MTEKTTHDLLIEELRAYFEDHVDWEKSHSHLSGMRVRAHLSTIRELATKRRDEIQAIRKQKPKTKSPGSREIAQVRQGRLDNLRK